MRVTGATPAVVVSSILKELLALGSLSILGGLVAGYIISALAGNYDLFLVFSHAVKPQFDLLLAVTIYAIVLATTGVAGMLCARSSLSRPPRDLIANIEPRRELANEEALPI
jgi:ABC-type antimicrobial peptide transport system permease subunit